MAMHDNELIIGEFGEESLQLAANILEKEEKEVFWNEILGLEIADLVRKTCRCYSHLDWSSDKMVYGIRARMQAGKTKAVLTAAWVLFKDSDCDFLVPFYSCSGRTDLEAKTFQEISGFLEGVKSRSSADIEIESFQDHIQVYLGERCFTLYIVHNTNNKAKDNCLRALNEASVDCMKILVWDEADQAFGHNSQRNKFIRKVLGLPDDGHAYDRASMSKRQSLNLLEFSISATGFANTMARQMELKEYSAEYSLVPHPNYIGLSEIKSLGYFFPAANICNRSKIIREGFDKFINSAMSKFLNSEVSQYPQYNRPLSFTRISTGIKMHERLFKEIESVLPDFKFQTVTEWDKFWSALNDSSVDVINVFYNNSKDKFTRDNLRKFLLSLKRGRVEASKKINFFIDGTIKEGDDLLNKCSDLIAFFWDRETKHKKPKEARIQSVGRICGIRAEVFLPPLIFSHPDLGEMIDAYSDIGICPAGNEIRRGVTIGNTHYDWAYVSASFRSLTREQCENTAEKFKTKLKDEYQLDSRNLYGRGFVHKVHSPEYKERIYPICEEYVANNDKYQQYDGKSVAETISSTNRKKGEEQGIIYFHRTDSNEFAFCVVFQGSDRNEIDTNLLSLRRRIPALGALFYLDSASRFSKPTMMHSAAK